MKDQEDKDILDQGKTMIKIKIINKSNNQIPEYATKDSAGMDIRAFLNEPVTIKSGEYKLIPTGIYLEIPVGYEIQIRARSGLAIKSGIGLINGIGTIDADYRGEIGVGLINFSKEDFTVNNGDRIAQMVLNKFESIDFVLDEELSETERGTGGFGSTGL